MPAAEGGITAARPRFPVDGQERAFLSEGLIGLTIHEDVDGLFACEATFGNWGNVEGRIDFLYFDRRMLDFGKSFAIAIGTDRLFDGRISGLEARFPDG